MKQLKKSFILLVLLSVMIGSQTSAQNFSLDSMLVAVSHDRAKEVVQDNEYTNTGYEEGSFYANSLMLNAKPLDYGVFNLQSKGELTVVKGAAITGHTTQVPFYVYLRRNGNIILIPRKERSDINQMKTEISEILKYAEPGDQLVIEPVRKEDGSAKRILKLLKGGC